jgi:hypothetical protein
VVVSAASAAAAACSSLDLTLPAEQALERSLGSQVPKTASSGGGGLAARSPRRPALKTFDAYAQPPPTADGLGRKAASEASSDAALARHRITMAALHQAVGSGGAASFGATNPPSSPAAKQHGYNMHGHKLAPLVLQQPAGHAEASAALGGAGSLDSSHGSLLYSSGGEHEGWVATGMPFVMGKPHPVHIQAGGPAGYALAHRLASPRKDSSRGVTAPHASPLAAAPPPSRQ